MNPAYRAWWRFLMDLRPMLRFFAERFPRLAPWAVRIRAVLHWLVGNPIQTVAASAAGYVWWLGLLPGSWFVGLVLVVQALVSTYCRVRFRRGGWLIAWREAWRIRRRWPADWAMVAAKTSRVQAEVGTSKEPIASAVLRPVADHPKLSWLPRMEWPVVSWWVGPPPGRSLEALDELTVILAANISHVSDIEVDYERENDSHGRLIMSFEDVLEKPSSPPWQDTDDKILLGADNGPGAGVTELVGDRDPAYPPLRVVDGEAS